MGHKLQVWNNNKLLVNPRYNLNIDVSDPGDTLSFALYVNDPILHVGMSGSASYRNLSSIVDKKSISMHVQILNGNEDVLHSYGDLLWTDGYDAALDAKLSIPKANLKLSLMLKWLLALDSTRIYVFADSNGRDVTVLASSVVYAKDNKRSLNLDMNGGLLEMLGEKVIFASIFNEYKNQLVNTYYGTSGPSMKSCPPGYGLRTYLGYNAYYVKSIMTKCFQCDYVDSSGYCNLFPTRLSVHGDILGSYPDVKIVLYKSLLSSAVFRWATQGTSYFQLLAVSHNDLEVYLNSSSLEC